MDKIRFIGDIHGDLYEWYRIIHGVSHSVQVGDFGVGFQPIPDPQNISLNHKFIRGNHDDPKACRLSSRWIEDGHYDPKHDIMYVGGAYSIDKQFRTPMINWWPDEELSYPEFQRVIDSYENLKPSIMVTHDCPTSISNEMFNPSQRIPNITSQALDIMFSLYQPKLWLFGHWHVSKVCVINGTRFICLGINSFIDIEVN